MNFDSRFYKKNSIADCESFLINEDKCDFIGFKPLSVRIKEMKVKGELTEIFNALENNNIEPSEFFSSVPGDVDKPISVLNIKGLDRIETIRALKDRYNSYLTKLAAYKSSFSDYKDEVVESETPQTSSEQQQE